MTPDLPIPEAAREAAVEAFRTHWDDSLLVETCACEQQFGTTPELEAHIVDAIVEATLPHLRSLQVETQLEYGKALGRAEAAEEIAEACAERARLANRIPESTRSGVREGMVVAWIAAEKLARGYGISAEVARLVGRSQATEAGSDGLTDLPVGPSHPKDSQTAREAL